MIEIKYKYWEWYVDKLGSLYTNWKRFQITTYKKNESEDLIKKEIEQIKESGNFKKFLIYAQENTHCKHCEKEIDIKHDAWTYTKSSEWNSGKDLFRCHIECNENLLSGSKIAQLSEFNFSFANFLGICFVLIILYFIALIGSLK